MKYTTQQLIDNILAFSALNGRAPVHKDNPGGVHSTTYERAFGSWNAALTAAGLCVNKRVDAVIVPCICEFCGAPFDRTNYETHRFCSRLCANKSRRVHPEIKKRTRDEWKQELKQKATDYRNQPFENIGWDVQREIVLSEQNHCCNKCGLSEWLGVTLSLEVDHIDGNNQNNNRENLEGLCPNCHSITPTWRGRNKPVKNGVNEVTDEFLKECLASTPNIRQALLKAGLAAKGNNYARAKLLL